MSIKSNISPVAIVGYCSEHESLSQIIPRMLTQAKLGPVKFSYRNIPCFVVCTDTPRDVWSRWHRHYRETRRLLADSAFD